MEYTRNDVYGELPRVTTAELEELRSRLCNMLIEEISRNINERYNAFPVDKFSNIYLTNLPTIFALISVLFRGKGPFARKIAHIRIFHAEGATDIEVRLEHWGVMILPFDTVKDIVAKFVNEIQALDRFKKLFAYTPEMRVYVVNY